VALLADRQDYAVGARSANSGSVTCAMAPELADEAYSLCLAVTGSAQAAASSAALALRRGGWSRTLVLGHAGQQAAAVASGASEDGPPTGDDVLGAARWLASTRPARERAVLDLADRHGLARTRLARALGRDEASAAAEVAGAASAWEVELHPALMAWLGPGPCEVLAALLGAGPGAAPGTGTGTGTGTATEGPATTPDDEAPVGVTSARQALEVAPAVAAHCADCAVCSDRRRAMVSVRGALAQAPVVPAPAPVRTVARMSRARPPLPITPTARSRWWTGRRATSAAALAAGVGAIAYLAWPGSPSPVAPSPASATAAAALARLPAGGSRLQLVTTPHAGSGTLRLVDTGTAPLRYQAETSSAWLTVAPATGQVAPGHAAVLVLSVLGTPQPGLRASVTASGSDGSVATATYTVP
jgi:hypothetical protein